MFLEEFQGLRCFTKRMWVGFWGKGGLGAWLRGGCEEGGPFVFLGVNWGGGIWESLGVGFVGDSSGYLISK
jgi:hypothetical protein